MRYRHTEIQSPIYFHCKKKKFPSRNRYLIIKKINRATRNNREIGKKERLKKKKKKNSNNNNVRNNTAVVAAYLLHQASINENLLFPRLSKLYVIKSRENYRRIRYFSIFSLCTGNLPLVSRGERPSPRIGSTTVTSIISGSPYYHLFLLATFFFSRG